MLFFRLGNNNQTDQGDKTEGLEGGIRDGGIMLCLGLT
jgi:hypothetical protein